MSFGAMAATAAIGTGLSVMQARQQNKAMARSMDSQARAVEIQQRQLAQQAGLERMSNERREAQAIGRIRAAAGSAGVSGGSVAALENQAAADAAINNTTILANYRNQIDAVRTGGQANLDQLASQYQSPILAGISGAMRGAQTGLAIGQGIKSFQS